MKRSLKVTFGMVLFLAFAYAAYAGIASIYVAPVTKSTVLSKDETTSGTYVVYNDSDEIKHVNVIPRYWHMVEENKTIPLDSWLKIDPAEFDIGPKEKREVVYTVSVPKEAVGELAVMIAFKPKPKEGQAVNVIFSVSLYVRIKESESIECKIANFKLSKFKDRKALSTRVSLNNTGNVHLKPKITVFIQNIFNKILQKADLKFGEPTYPGRVQDYRGAIYNFKLNPGLYKAEIYGEDTITPLRFRRKVYFMVGREGKVIFTFFRRPDV